MRSRTNRWWVGGVLLTALVGCTTSPQLAEVEGTVTLDGKPIEGVRVEFMPDPEAGHSGPNSTGVTDAQGRFQLRCENQQNGAVIGKHRVTLTDLKQWEGLTTSREDANKPLKPSRIPAKYTDVVQTPFRGIEVKTSGNTISLEVKTP
ncbi:MAG: hypothetical protein RMJ56_00715 [Gemmataceae bacterium]|nr:DUF4198 domain-containing protein [Gemmata sp.]MDW8196102.1 hypothetical protein [Gemmataceae bacterium]